ncbi:Cation channel sperm-associated protein 1 [Podochytrium sp. JEL0797]|nr:Cation channel sperm-associated protein 1 [Podochytrium sp. JEL0797]
MLHSLQVIISIVFKSVPAMLNIAALSLITLYVLAVIATASYRDVDPRRFGSISTSLFRLFQLMTLDKWSDIVNENREKSKTIQFFVVFVIVLETLFIAVIVNNLQTARKIINTKRVARTHGRKIGQVVGSVDSFEQALLTRGASIVDRRQESTQEKDDALDGIVEEVLGIENYYSGGLPQRTKELLSSYFQHLSSLEYNLHGYEKQQKVLDELIDIGKEK